MAMKIILTILVGAFAVVCLPKPLYEELTWEGFVKILEEVPESSKYSFVSSNYLEGYEIAHGENLEELNSDSQLAFAIYTILNEATNRNAEHIKDVLIRRDTICFPLPIGCIDSGDAGIRPK